MNKSYFCLIVFVVLGVAVMEGNLLAQDVFSPDQEEVIKLQEKKITDLDIEKSDIDREYDYLTNTRENNDNPFQQDIILGLSKPGGGSRFSFQDSRENFFRVLGGTGYYFLGELSFIQQLNEDLLKIYFLGLSQQNLSSLLENETLDNSQRYRFDMDISYRFSRESENGNSFLHTIEGSHTDYSIGLQEFTIFDEELFYYFFRLGYQGDYLFSSLMLTHSFFIDGGKYALPATEDDAGFVETGYDIEMRGIKGRLSGLYGKIIFDMDWQKNNRDQDSLENYRFLIGLGLGYDWEISSRWTLNFYLGHILEILKTKEQVDIDVFYPIVVLPKVGLTFLLNPSMLFNFEVGIKTETENLWQLYNRESFYSQGTLAYLNRLAEGKITFRYDNPKLLQGMGIDVFAFYHYYFNYERDYYIPGQFKFLTEDKSIKQISAGIHLKIQILRWLGIENKSVLNVNSPIDRFIFPFLDTESKITFSIAQIFSRVLFRYHNLISKIYTQDFQGEWSLTKQNFDIGYEFEYNHFVFQLSVENILDRINYQELPGFQQKKFSISGGIKYFF